MQSVSDLDGFSEKGKEILSRIYREGAITRKELQKTSHLKIANFYNTIEQLLQTGIIRITERDYSNTKGRPSEQLIFNDEFCYCFCIILSRVQYYFAIADLSGKQLVSSVPYSQPASFDDFFSDLTNFYSEQNKSEKFSNKICYCCIASGIHIENGHFKTSNLQWNGIPILKMLEEKLGCKVFYNTLSQAAAFGIYFSSFRKQTQSLIFFNLSKGIGMGIILAQKPLNLGKDDHPSIEHWILDTGGRQCNCGENGCVITSVGTEKITENIDRQLKLGFSSTLKDKAGDLTFTDIVEAANAKDPLAVSAMEEAACVFTIAIKNVISIFRVPVVIVGGQLCENNPLFFSILQERVKQKGIPIQLYQEKNFSSKIIIGLTSETVERLLGE